MRLWTPEATTDSRNLRRRRIGITSVTAAIVRTRLTGYLSVASPTSAVAAGQKTAGLFGAVHVETLQ